jgi:hypothetical protein
MNFPESDWFIIRLILKNIADDERENQKTLQSNNLVDPNKIEEFIRQVNAELGSE